MSKMKATKIMIYRAKKYEQRKHVLIMAMRHTMPPSVFLRCMMYTKDYDGDGREQWLEKSLLRIDDRNYIGLEQELPRVFRRIPSPHYIYRRPRNYFAEFSFGSFYSDRGGLTGRGTRYLFSRYKRFFQIATGHFKNDELVDGIKERYTCRKRRTRRRANGLHHRLSIEDGTFRNGTHIHGKRMVCSMFTRTNDRTTAKVRCTETSMTNNTKKTKKLPDSLQKFYIRVDPKFPVTIFALYAPIPTMTGERRKIRFIRKKI